MEEILTTLLNPENQIYQLVMAIFLGSFIGLRRELDLQKMHKEGLMGLRTMPLLVLLGTISTFFPTIPLLPLFVFLGISIFIIIAYSNGVFNLKRIGLTTEVTGLIMFLVGVLIGNSEIWLAIIITIVVGAFNAYKLQMHNFAKNISLKEWTGGMQLLIISLVVLPLLPKTAIDPWEVFIPFNIWFFVVLLSGIGFVGYFLNKYFGDEKSVFLTSILGSIVSSTAITTSLATKSKLQKKLSINVFIAAILLSIGIMEARVLLEILILSKGFHLEFILAPLLMLIMSIILFFYIFAKDINKKQKTKAIKITPELESPFEIIPALKFATFFTILLFVIHFTKTYLAGYGIYVVTFFIGFIDVDSIILSILETFKNGGADQELVWKIISLAVLVNTFVKIIYIYIFGRKDLLKPIIFYVSLVLISGMSVFLIF